MRYILNIYIHLFFVWVDCCNAARSETPPTVQCGVGLQRRVRMARVPTPTPPMQSDARDAIRAAVNLINVAVAPGDKAMQTEIWQTGRVGSVDAFFGAHGETVMKALLLAGAEHAPRPALRPIAQTIHAVRQSYNVPGKTVDKWITSVLADGNFPSPQSPVPESTRSTFCQIITKGDDNITESLQPRRWSAACVDFFQICRGELGADALVAHQM